MLADGGLVVSTPTASFSCRPTEAHDRHSILVNCSNEELTPGICESRLRTGRSRYTRIKGYAVHHIGTVCRDHCPDDPCTVTGRSTPFAHRYLNLPGLVVGPCFCSVLQLMTSFDHSDRSFSRSCLFFGLYKYLLAPSSTAHVIPCSDETRSQLQTSLKQEKTDRDHDCRLCSSLNIHR